MDKVELRNSEYAFVASWLSVSKASRWRWLCSCTAWLWLCSCSIQFWKKSCVSLRLLSCSETVLSASIWNACLAESASFSLARLMFRACFCSMSAPTIDTYLRLFSHV
jgi:hypothetical protein